jgi:hypothetical protein
MIIMSQKWLHLGTEMNARAAFNEKIVTLQNFPSHKLLLHLLLESHLWSLVLQVCLAFLETVASISTFGHYRCWVNKYGEHLSKILEMVQKVSILVSWQRWWQICCLLWPLSLSYRGISASCWGWCKMWVPWFLGEGGDRSVVYCGYSLTGRAHG